jgi:hypothetical protein
LSSYQSAEKLYEDLESFRKNPEYKFEYSDLEFTAADRRLNQSLTTGAEHQAEFPPLIQALYLR